ncbi:MAG: disulfide bond formation protein DsbA [Acidimicrobiales bacterium]|nr:disulfide bond formation protein DsbA [Acidimicrobiales bacterium]
MRVKNESEHEALVFTHNLLRVMEAVRADQGDDRLKDLYWEYARRIHHDHKHDFTAADALQAVGIDVGYADAFADPIWDEAVETETACGIELVGPDVGTPILALTYQDGAQASIFGPVMTPIPSGQAALDLWDGMTRVMSVPGFFELKRTRDVGPDLGPRP